MASSLNSLGSAPERTNWIGFHGTSLDSAKRILVDNYRISYGCQEWLGHGAYFFISGYGFTDPLENASDWAKFRAWDSAKKCYKYNDFAVLQSNLTTVVHLDLDNEQDFSIFRKVRDAWMTRIRNEGFKGKNAISNDCFLMNFAFNELRLDALVKREAINSRRDQVKTRIPNCRIMCLKDPSRCASQHSIVKRGKI